MDELLEVEKKMTRRGKWLCRAGWAAFAASLAMPAVHVMDWISGWECFRFVIDLARGEVMHIRSLSDAGWYVYYSMFAATNLLLVASPLVLRKFRKDRKWLRRSAILCAAAAAQAASYPIVATLDNGSIRDLNIGYYTWLLSFGLVAAGAQHLALGVRNQNVNQTPLVTGRTKEELMALQELEAYLGRSEATVKQPDAIEQPAPEQTENQRESQAEELRNRVTWALGLSS